MDFIFCAGTVGIRVKNILLTYDVACQWRLYFFDRLEELPLRIRFPLGRDAISFGVPKFHLPPHSGRCQAPHSLNFKPGAGETDGESIERNWALLNGAAASTREMGPGSRHDTLDDYCGHSNWRKLVTLGTQTCDVLSLLAMYLLSSSASYEASLMSRRLVGAIAEAQNHIGIYLEFNADLHASHPDKLVAWRRQILAYEEGGLDMDEKSPYDVEGEGKFYHGQVLMWELIPHNTIM